MQKTAAIIGVTGMIGQQLLEQLIAGSHYETIRLIVRRPYAKPNERVEVKLVDFNDTESLHLALEGVDVVFSAIGTTQKNVKGNKTLYRQIDYDIPLRAARLAKETGCEQFVIVSSVGADSKSNNFYLKLKGELEDALQTVGLRSVHIFQPSVLLGHRKEKRPGEGILQSSMKFISNFLPGGWRKYRAIKGEIVARAMIKVAEKNKPGLFRYTYDDIISCIP